MAKTRKLAKPRTPEEQRAVHRGLSKLYKETYGRYGTWPAHKKAVAESKKGVFLGRRWKRRKTKPSAPTEVVPGSQEDVYRRNLTEKERERYRRSGKKK